MEVFIKMTNKIKLLVGKILNRKSVIDLDNDGKIESYREEIQGVFSQFKHMHVQLGSVNEKLNEIAIEEKRNVELANQRIEKINNELNANLKLQEKVQDFIV